ncbi:MAG TPA: STN domain-containing protein, partial [Candidatus Acidoferrum sp.]|nr:STN domain-containing protein [Candidatus Acidoferrum sp.]
MNRNTARLSHRAAKRTSKKKSKISKWPVTYRFVAMGTLVAYTAFGASKITLAQSPELASTAQTQTSGSPAPTRRFEIPAGSLDSTVSAFEILTHIHVSFVDDGIRLLASPGVQGTYTDEQALDRLLDDSGVTYKFT